MTRKILALNEKGRRIGESHHNAKLSNEMVDKIRECREEHGLTYLQLANLFQISKSTIADICNYRRRAQTPMRFKTILVPKVA